ncbi:hypothetical protein VSS74_17145 [Conexibacter stalactiti]|uniref:ABC transporter substrate-binding protein n=1 Tax=Conexibacter stalactiti TaxID=1940611 RepID=A0ABU4HRZ5_9ACTN|nr:hypothetical protein [Conexibacter stalactiti]MDW5596076.1 hypothetical protein [Conexibacter stalactiti]MEC5036718.1 hypothetical protein [Conexibacter stalactiti]
MVLLLACAMVATDFVRHPFQGAAPGDAASGRRDVTLWLAGTDAGTVPARLARAAARQLGEPGASARVETVRGGSSAAVLAVLDDEAGTSAPLLVVHAGTLADLARERGDAGLPGVPEQARRATRLLRAARPLALLADDTLVVASSARSGPRTPAALLASLRRAPGRLVFGIGGDAWSYMALAGFVSSANASGRVPYRVVPAIGSDVALAERDVDVVLAPASELHGQTTRGALRPLAQSDRGPRVDRRLRVGPAVGADAALPPLADLLADDGPVAHAHRWVALVAPATLPARERRALSPRLRALVRSRAWARVLRRTGLGRAPASTPARTVARAWTETDALTTAAARVDRLAVSP